MAQLELMYGTSRYSVKSLILQYLSTKPKLNSYFIINNLLVQILFLWHK